MEHYPGGPREVPGDRIAAAMTQSVPPRERLRARIWSMAQTRSHTPPRRPLHDVDVVDGKQVSVRRFANRGFKAVVGPTPRVPKIDHHPPDPWLTIDRSCIRRLPSLGHKGHQFDASLTDPQERIITPKGDAVIRREHLGAAVANEPDGFLNETSKTARDCPILLHRVEARGQRRRRESSALGDGQCPTARHPRGARSLGNTRKELTRRSTHSAVAQRNSITARANVGLLKRVSAVRICPVALSRFRESGRFHRIIESARHHCGCVHEDAYCLGTRRGS